MFVGEQRFIEEDTRKFMEYYRQKIAEEDGEFVSDDSGKGLTGKIAALDKLDEEEKDLDEESESEEEEEEEKKEEEEEEKKEEVPKATDRAMLDEKKKKTVGSDESDDDEDEDEDEEDEDDEDEDEEDEDEEGDDDEEEEDDEEEGSEEEEDDDEEEGSEEEEDEEEEEEAPAPKKRQPMTRLEDKSISSRPLSGQSVRSMDIQIQNMSHRTGGGNFQGDAPSIFNRSRVQINSTLKNYDDEEEEGAYRL